MNTYGLEQAVIENFSVDEGGFVLRDLPAEHTGTYGFMTCENGLYKYCLFEAVKGEALRVPLQLRPGWTYHFKIYNPDNSIYKETVYTLQIKEK